MPRPQLNTLRNRVVLLIIAITAMAIGFIYLYVVPQLQSSLTAEKLRRLERLGNEQEAALSQALGRAAPPGELSDLVREISQTTEARVTLLALSETDGSLEPDFVIADSESEASAVLPSYGVASAAVDSDRVASGVEGVSGERVGESAVPIPEDGEPRWVAVLSSPLDEVDDNVALIKRQILIAGLIALAFASFAGYWAARFVSQRLGRLRRAAEHVAAGDFTEPIPVDSYDELGQLALTFNDMQRRLARLDRARKEFIANASHELRTPIFSLGGFIELLEEENPDPAEREEFVGEMRAQIERLQKLTTDLLDLSKLDADVLEISPERVDVTELARTIAGEFRAAARLHRSELELRSPEGEPAIAICDPNRVGQILRILLDNALTHTTRGTKVTVTATRARDAVELIVGDEGGGIDPRYQDRVFERFYSGDSAAGSGLGLAIAAELASRMGGSLNLVSRRAFTAFTLRLPIAKGTQRSRATAGATA